MNKNKKIQKIGWKLLCINLWLSFLVLPVTAEELKLDDVVKKLEQQDKLVKDVQFSLIQEINIKVTGEKRKVLANVKYKKPNKIYIEYTAPQKQVVVSDGKKIQISIPAYDQIVTTDWTSWTKTGFFPKEMLNFGATMKDLNKKYNFTLLGYEDGYYKISLVPPKSKEYGFRLWVSDKTWFAEKMELYGETFLVTTQVENLKFNQNLDDNIFIINKKNNGAGEGKEK